MKFNTKQFSMLTILILMGCGNGEPEPFVKEIYTYKSVVIGSQEWMAEDLKNNCYCDGTPILEVKNASRWASLTEGGWSYMDNDKTKYGMNGKLYNWYAVNGSRNICPCGWHVPGFEDWTQLIDFLGGPDSAGGSMKTTGTFQAGDGLWVAPNEGATNSSGFSAIPNGSRNSNGSFNLPLLSSANWWASSIGTESYFVVVGTYNASVDMIDADKKIGFSVRCVKD